MKRIQQKWLLGDCKIIMPFDFKKEYKEYYMPKNKPSIIEILK